MDSIEFDTEFIVSTTMGIIDVFETDPAETGKRIGRYITELDDDIAFGFGLAHGRSMISPDDDEPAVRNR